MAAIRERVEQRQQIERQRALTITVLREYIDNGRVHQALMTEGSPFYLPIQLVSFERGVVRIFYGGRFTDCKYLHLRNIYMVQFVMHVYRRIIMDWFSLALNMVGVNTNNADFLTVIKDVGRRIDHVVQRLKNRKMMDVHLFMLDMHPDVICHVKGVAKEQE